MTPMLETAGWALIHFVWQGCAIAAVVAAALRVAERRSANVRYVIACVGLAAMLAAPAVTARLLRAGDEAKAPSCSAGLQACESGPGNPAAAVLHASASPEARSNERAAIAGGVDGRATERAKARASLAARLPSLDRLVPAVTIVWLAGVLLLLGRMAGGWWRVQRLHRSALASASSRWQTACRRLAYRLGLPAAAHVVESALVDVPTVVGWLRPAILCRSRRSRRWAPRRSR